MINDVCELQAWPPRNLARFLGLDRFTSTTYRQCETGEEFDDLPAREVIEKIRARAHRGFTTAMLGLYGRRFRAPTWLERHSVTASAASQRCVHEETWPHFETAFQMCEANSATQSHFDFTGHRALLLILKGKKLIAITASRKFQFGRLDKWMDLDESDPARLWDGC